MKKSYVYKDGKMVEKMRSKQERFHHIQADIEPYQSMIDGSMISSRSQHRKHLKQHGCIEVGNEKMENKPVKHRDTRKEVLREQLANMSHRDANRILERIREEVRFSNPYRK